MNKNLKSDLRVLTITKSSNSALQLSKSVTDKSLFKNLV